MSDKQQELLSALFDGEASEFETRRILQELDDEHKASWQCYQLISDTANHKVEANFIDIDICAAVSSAIANEPVPTPTYTDEKANTDERGKSSHWLKPAVGFAAAASIAFVTVLSIQGTTVDEINPAPVSTFVANGKVNASQLNIESAVGLSAASGSAELPLQQQISEINEQKRIERQRLDYFLNQHAQQATFNNNRGLMPMARMATEEK